MILVTKKKDTHGISKVPHFKTSWQYDTKQYKIKGLYQKSINRMLNKILKHFRMECFKNKDKESRQNSFIQKMFILFSLY